MSNASNEMAYFIDWTFRKSGPLEKAHPGPIEKADPMPKFTALVKNTCMTN